jgi:adenylosuccinate lyase
MGFAEAVAVSGQTYTRKLDAQVLGVVAGIAASGAKFSGDIRMLQAFGELEEPFGSEQIGSSAMAYKRNPMRSERIAGLARFVLSLEPNANQTHSAQYLERTLDDSANRRLAIPESFLATDAILVLQEGIAGGLQVHQPRIRRRLEDELPFMVTEELIVRAVRAGADRQDAHERVRRATMDGSRTGDGGADRNAMLARLAADPMFHLSEGDARALLDPGRHVGRAPEQVDEFLAEVLEPALADEVEGPATEREEAPV